MEIGLHPISNTHSYCLLGKDRNFFKTRFYNPASAAAVARAPEETRFVLRKMRLTKGDRLLDLCCGPGRHSVPLAKKAWKSPVMIFRMIT